MTTPIVFSSPTAVLAIRSDDRAMIDALRSALRRDFSLDAAISILTSKGLSAMPHFVCAAPDGDAMRVFARGSIWVHAETADGVVTVEAPSHAATWREEVLVGALLLTISCEGSTLVEWIAPSRDATADTEMPDSPNPPSSLWNGPSPSNDGARFAPPRRAGPAAPLGASPFVDDRSVGVTPSDERMPTGSDEAEVPESLPPDDLGAATIEAAGSVTGPDAAGSDPAAVAARAPTTSGNLMISAVPEFTIVSGTGSTRADEAPPGGPPDGGLPDADAGADHDGDDITAVVARGSSATSTAGDHDGMTVVASNVRGLVTEIESARVPAGLGHPPTVEARHCVASHPNPPTLERCRVCRATVSAPTVTIHRPSVARLSFDNGMTVEVDRPQIIGRRPSLPDIRTGGEIPNLIAVSDPDQDLSRNHVSVELEGWVLVVTDLGSTNGTVVTHPGQSPARLRSDESMPLVDGSRVGLGDVASFVVEAPSW